MLKMSRGQSEGVVGEDKLDPAGLAYPQQVPHFVTWGDLAYLYLRPCHFG